MAEYSTVVTHIDLKPEAYSQTGDQMAKNLTAVLGKVLKSTAKLSESFQGGKWEILSHQIFRIGDHLLVSFLLRR